MSAAERHEAARRLQEATVALLNHTSSVDAAHACTSALCAVVDLLNKDAFGADAVARAVLDAAQPQAPITAEDVRAAEDSWSALGAAGRVDSILSHHKDRYGHMADYLNRRRERS